MDGFRTRVRVYDYGVISLALTRPFSGPWSALVAAAQTLVENAELEQRADEQCRAIAARLAPALVGPRRDFLSEDYIVFSVNELAPPQSAELLLVERGAEIALMLRGERQALSAQEQDTVLQHRLSYLADDLVVATWNAALVSTRRRARRRRSRSSSSPTRSSSSSATTTGCSTRSSPPSTPQLQRPRWYDRWGGRRYARAARQLHSAFIDLNELTDRTENALKFVGDVYAARLFTLAADRLGLERWKANVQEKLKTADDIYRFAVEQSSMSRGELLELTIVLILVLELVLVFMGVMK